MNIIDSIKYEREIKHEQDMKDRGYEKVMTMFEEGKEKNMAHVQSYINKLYIPLIERINEQAELDSKKSGVRSNLIQCLKHITPEQASFVTTKYMVESCLVSAKVNSLMINVAKNIYATMRSNIWNNKKLTEEEKQSAYDIVETLKDKGTIFSILFLELFSEKVADNSEEILNNVEKFYVVYKKKRKGKRESPLTVEPSPKFLEMLNESLEFLAETTVTNKPMLEIPHKWDDRGFNGGYYDRMFKKNLVKPHYFKLKTDRRNSVLAPSTVEAINAIQETPWRINRYILDVITELNKTKPSSLDKVFPADPEKVELPPRVSTEEFNAMSTEEKDERRTLTARYQRARKKVAGNRSIELNRKIALTQAIEYQLEKQFYFPYDVDYRGRIYSMSMSGLNPQGSDLSKGLIQLAKGHKITTERGQFWLHVNMANLMGFDKATLHERVLYVLDNMELLQRIVDDPIENAEWHEWDKPVQGLACAYDFVMFNYNPDHELHTHIQLDGLCNGVQNLAAISRDLDVAPHLGLIETEKRGDIYQYVCNAIQAKLDKIKANPSHKEYSYAEHWINSGLVNRTLTKKPVMTRSYAATLYGIKEGVKDYILDKEKAGHFQELVEEANWMGKLIWDTMNMELLGPMAVMEYFQKVAKEIGKYGRALEWITPSGNACYYAPRTQKQKNIKIRLNRKLVCMTMKVETEKINTSKLASSIAPNIIHSFDASHLTMTTNRCVEQGIHEFAFVHDSFGTYPDATDKLLQCAKDAWVEMYSINQLDRMYQEWCLLYPECDIPYWGEHVTMGDLDVNDVQDSDFFFA